MNGANAILLNRFFSRNTFVKIITEGEISAYAAVIRRYVGDFNNKTNAECISGIPQVVVKQLLTKEGENTDKGFSIAENLEYIIIGPTLYPHTVADALVCELEKYGIKEPWMRIRESGIS